MLRSLGQILQPPLAPEISAIMQRMLLLVQVLTCMLAAEPPEAVQGSMLQSTQLLLRLGLLSAYSIMRAATLIMMLVVLMMVMIGTPCCLTRSKATDAALEQGD